MNFEAEMYKNWGHRTTVWVTFDQYSPIAVVRLGGQLLVMQRISTLLWICFTDFPGGANDLWHHF